MFRYLFNIYSCSIFIYALSVHLLVLLDIKQHELNSDVKSAIERTKTSKCKNELINFAHLNEENERSLKLPRSCQYDQQLQRNIRKGCITNTSHGLVKLNEEIRDINECLDYCYSFRHSQGGFHPTLGCYCGDNETYVDSPSCFKSNEFDWYQVNSKVFQLISNSPLELPRRHEVKIAFLFLLSGRMKDQVERIFNLLYSQNHLYYFHVDSIDVHLYDFVLELEKRYANVVLARKRYRTIWGSPYLLSVMINCMNELSLHEWDYLINLSESDFPLKPLTEIEDYLSRSNLIFLKSHNIKGYHFIKKQGLNKYFYQCEDRVWRLGTRSLPTGIIYAGGSDWFVLPKDFCDYIVINQHNSSSLIQPLLKLFEHTLLPAESFFHTVALNTEYCDRFANSNLRLTNWNLKLGCGCQHRDVVDWCGCSPQIYRNSDRARLKQASLRPDTLFSRKFDPSISSDIIDYVESHLVKKNSIIKLDVPNNK